MSFINKVVLVTGAGSGIGEAICLHFAKLSARLSLVDKDAGNLKKTAEICEKLSRAKVLTTVADLRIDTQVKEAVENTKKQFGKIDVVINCAGIYKPASIFDANLIEVYDDILSSNLRSIVSMTNCVAEELAKTNGNIINVSSVSGAFKCALYKASAGALDHFTASVALELASKGVRINSIAPGVVKTSILANAGVDQEEREALWNEASSSPLNKLVKTEDVVELAAFLASDKAKAMTGCTYPVDAGLALA
ncbi:oxidoreductase UcpA-like [Helicoverpa zea]|uniref:oxidoreductase UcpA-like n=1 Tax=Helicoverpa zea TaxID=7113 RepID=UPI001F56B0BF|nr:oxidoreductase UcpA-like [Helicoverpa zea]